MPPWRPGTANGGPSFSPAAASSASSPAGSAWPRPLRPLLQPSPVSFRDVMLHASLSAFLRSLFVLLAGANVWVMLHASSRSKDPAAHARLMWAHRLGGYTFILLFCVFFYFMALRIKGSSDELPPRLTFHVILALLLIPILLVKVLIARYYRHYSSALLFLGVTIFALSFALVAMNLVLYLLGRAASTGAPASLSLGFFLTVCSGLGFLLLRRPRQPTPAGSRATPSDTTDGLTADASRPEIRRRRSSSLRLQLARIDVQTHNELGPA